MKRALIGTTVLGSCLAMASMWAASSTPAVANETAAQSDTKLDGNVRLLKIAIPSDGKLGDLLRKNARLTSGMEVLKRTSIPTNLLRSRRFDKKAWSSIGVDVVLMAEKGAGQLRMSLFELSKGDRPVISRRYPAADMFKAANAFMNDVVQYYTGEQGVFGSRIAFVRTRRNPFISKNVLTAEMNGEKPARVTSNRSLNILPSITPGGEVLFTSYAKRNPDLWISGGAKPKRLSRHPGLNLGGTMSPDGNTIALALSKDGNSEIYTVDRSGKIKARLTRSAGIDGSPSWSPGGQIAFVSDRVGSPQIFRMAVNGGGVTRVTRSGSYNASPDWNSGKNSAQWIAYSGRDRSNHFDIFKVNIKNGKVVRLTQDAARNEDPSWSPDGRLVAYTKNSSIYVANSDGNNATQVIRGASTPDWGPRAAR